MSTYTLELGYTERIGEEGQEELFPRYEGVEHDSLPYLRMLAGKHLKNDTDIFGAKIYETGDAEEEMA